LYVHGGEHFGNGRVKIIDFGTANRFKPKIKYSEIYGSVTYVAPEVYNMEYTEKCDIWSLGVVLYILILRKTPFDGDLDKDVVKNIKNNSITFNDALGSKKSIECIDIMKRMLYKDPKSRISMQDVMLHKWIRVMGKDPNETKKVKSALKAIRKFANLGTL
jgi:calcium-dependent protein kinase